MREKNAKLLSVLKLQPVVPVLIIDDVATAVPLARALVAGGLKAIEITLRTTAALEAIRAVANEVEGAVAGAGTILNAAQFEAAVEAGSQFIVTPGITRDLLEASVNSPIPLLPGISNASGIMEGYGLGYRRFKLFPAEVSGGVAAIKALGGPFGEVKFCPTGGVSPANIKSYMALKNVMCVGGSWMLDPEWIKNGDWARIQECTAEALALLD